MATYKKIILIKKMHYTYVHNNYALKGFILDFEFNHAIKVSHALEVKMSSVKKCPHFSQVPSHIWS